MRIGPSIANALVGLGLAATIPSPVQAAEFVALPMALVAGFDMACAASPMVAASAPVVGLAPASKASAILGGAVSELDRIRLEQERGPAMVAALEAPIVELQAQPALAPAVGGPRFDDAACLQWARPQSPMAPAQPGARDDILGSKRLAIGQTTFDAEWARVSRERVSRARFQKAIGPAASDAMSKLRRVNRWVNHAVAYVEDQDLYRRADYWAGASRTLRLRKGDCEDIALTKLQLLAAAGIARSDMVLTIARDLVRNADHALLMVKVDGRYLMLDNATDEVLEASGAQDYRPVLSFGPGQAWLHGYQTAALTAR